MNVYVQGLFASHLKDLKSNTVNKSPMQKTRPHNAMINEGKANNKNTLNTNVPSAPMSFISPLITSYKQTNPKR
jgi:hypothetical protein